MVAILLGILALDNLVKLPEVLQRRHQVRRGAVLRLGIVLLGIRAVSIVEVGSHRAQDPARDLGTVLAAIADRSTYVSRRIQPHPTGSPR